MLTPSKARSSFIVTAGIVATLLGTTACATSDRGEPTETPAPSATTQPSETPQAEQAEEVDDAERSEALDRALKDSLGVQDAYTELAAVDASLWGGYVANVRVEGARAYITLQVAADDPQRDDLGSRAAKASSTLLPATAVEDINWIIVEDAEGTVIAQEQPAPIM